MLRQQLGAGHRQRSKNSSAASAEKRLTELWVRNMKENTRQVAETTMKEQIEDEDSATLESIASKSDGLLHIVLEYDPSGQELTASEAQDAFATVLGMYEGVLRNHPSLYNRAALDFCVGDGARVRYELPTPWFNAYHANRISLEEVYDRVWDTLHYIDPEGVPRSKAEVLEELPDDVDLE